MPRGRVTKVDIFARVYKLKNDLILVFGEEPSMKWKTYSENISNTLLLPSRLITKAS